ncbi:MAG TPA: hypothetical protein DCO86_02155 [Spirochaetaceae bacterium]|nr:hypothetical protein [Spirochaetaceae bacterium]
MREIEAKARVGFFQLNNVFSYMNKKFGTPEKTTKVDTYFHKSGTDGEFRVRRIEDDYFYNVKVRVVEDGIENNIETERKITKEEAKQIEKDNAPFGIKTKREYVWNTQYKGYEVHIELADVINLGIFLEIEVLVDEKAPTRTVNAIKKYIMGFYEKLELADRIEKRKYLDMLFGC